VGEGEAGGGGKDDTAKGKQFSSKTTWREMYRRPVRGSERESGIKWSEGGLRSDRGFHGSSSSSSTLGARGLYLSKGGEDSSGFHSLLFGTARTG
jgi:hypothetical protein